MPQTTTSSAGRDPVHGAALLIVDMISCWDFPDAAPLLAQALRVAPNTSSRS